MPGDDPHDSTRPGPRGGPDPTATARLRGQWLTGRPGRRPAEVVRHLLAVQAQDLVGARLAIRARSAGLTAADVDAALLRRELVVTWLNRGTLHLVCAEDYGWLHALTAPRTRPGADRRLRQLGVSPGQAERGVATVVDAIRQSGPRTRSQLKASLDDAGVPTAGQALIHVLASASLQGLVVRGPVSGAEQAYVLVEDWLGPATPAPDRAQGLGRLGARYRLGHPAGGPDDLAAWAGVTLGDARAALASADLSDAPPCGRQTPDDSTRTRGTTAGDPTAGDPTEPTVGPVPDPVLLGPFDPALHGWPDRRWLLGPYRQVVTTNGIFRATILVEGRVVGTWTRPRGQVELRLFEEIGHEAHRVLAADAEDVVRFLTASPAR